MKSGITSAWTKISSKRWATTDAEARRSGAWQIFLLGGFLLVGTLPAVAQALQDKAGLAGPDPAVVEKARDLSAKGARYLLAAQEQDGGWEAERGPGISALVLKALIEEATVGPEHPAVRRGVELVLRSQRPDGGMYSAEGLLKNYETSVAVSMLSAFPDKRYTQQIAAGVKFLKDTQWDEGDGKSLDDPWYGGAGYGHGKRPDLSNTQMMLDALRDSGLPPDDPAYKKALVFIQRCQMLGESNDQSFAKGSTQGGFIYSPANGGESKAGTVAVDGREELRSYGSMTYAGYKSLLYCGLTLDDPRVQAAAHWIRRHWTLDHNPNMPAKQSQEGLFYYYHVFARTLRAMNTDIVMDAAGRAHDWRRELVEKLASLQKSDGSWVNDADRWMEGHPALTTAYALLALHEAAN
jgi:squalene-hopene/tetraprenyl-beta-curcumene cyclase